MEKYVNINGAIEPSEKAFIPFDSRAFRYGWGVFETILYKNGHLIHEQEHFDRLFQSLAICSIKLPMQQNATFFSQQIKELIDANGIDKFARIRLQIWPGSGTLFNTDNQTSYIIEATTLTENDFAFNSKGLTVGIATNVQKTRNTFSGIKSCNAMPYALAAQEASASNLDDAILLNDAGRVVETTIGNIFIVKNKTVITPPLSEGPVAGVKRAFVLKLLAENDFNHIEAPITVLDLMDADEIMITNAVKNIRWVHKMGHRVFGNEMVGNIAQLVLQSF